MTRYLVVYMYGSKTGYGISHVDCKMKNNPPSIEDVIDIQRKLADEKKSDDIVILNWLPLTDSGENENC